MGARLRVLDSVFGISNSGPQVWGLGSRIEVSEIKAQGLGLSLEVRAIYTQRGFLVLGESRKMEASSYLHRHIFPA